MSSSGFCETFLNQMENSAYGPSPIPTQHPAAALVAFSQASSLSEALRLSRPFPQVMNANRRQKSTPRPYWPCRQSVGIFF